MISSIGHWSNRHSSARSRNTIIHISSIFRWANHITMSINYCTWPLSLRSILWMKSSLETTCKILSTFVDILVDNSLVILVLPRILVDIFMTLLIGSACQFFQTFVQLNISNVLLNLFVSIWLRIDCTLRISWSACCRRASSLSYSSRSYSFEDIVSTHRWSIAMRRLSLYLTRWLEILDNRWVVGIVLFWKISVTHLIWILSTCSVLVLIYST